MHTAGYNYTVKSRLNSFFVTNTANDYRLLEYDIVFHMHWFAGPYFSDKILNLFLCHSIYARNMLTRSRWKITGLFHQNSPFLLKISSGMLDDVALCQFHTEKLAVWYFLKTFSGTPTPNVGECKRRSRCRVTPRSCPAAMSTSFSADLYKNF